MVRIKGELMKLVISEQSGKSYQTEVSKDKESLLAGKKIGDEVEGNLFGAAGYSFILCGGSDGSGFPMRKDVSGSGRKSILLSGGIGFKSKNSGERRRKAVRGNAYSAEIMQINVKVKTAGPTPLEQIFPKKEETKK